MILIVFAMTRCVKFGTDGHITCLLCYFFTLIFIVIFPYFKVTYFVCNILTWFFSIKNHMRQWHAAVKLLICCFYVFIYVVCKEMIWRWFYKYKYVTFVINVTYFKSNVNYICFYIVKTIPYSIWNFLLLDNICILIWN